MATIPEISVKELEALLASKEKLFILDVREENEYNAANIGGVLIPLMELPQRLSLLEPHKEKPIVVHCRSGARSAKAVEYLRAFGFEHAQNLRGGLLAWRDQIDPTLNVQ